MSATGSFESIVGDLEKLPCELHKGVLADLEFGQLIRISPFAGPRLIWSLENSPSYWSRFFRDGKMSEWERLLAVTDQVSKLCLRPPKSYNDPYTFEETYPGSFLVHKCSDWERRNSCADSFGLVDRDSLSHHWLHMLNVVIIDTTWKVFHQDYSRHIEPWVSLLDGAAEVFGKVLLNCQAPSLPNRMDPVQSLLSIDELASFINLYQRLRRMKAKVIAAGMYRLAELYDAHPTRLEMPFAPQTRRLNEKHVSANIRHKARKMLRRSKTTWLGVGRLDGYRFSSTLVPYDWCVQLFVKLLQKHALSEPVYPKAVAEKCKIVLEERPSWVADVQTKADPIADMSKAFEQLKLGSGTPISMQILKDAAGNAYRPHVEIELKWLENFAEVIVWMECEFLDMLREVRGHGWDAT